MHLVFYILCLSTVVSCALTTGSVDTLPVDTTTKLGNSFVGVDRNLIQLSCFGTLYYSRIDYICQTCVKNSLAGQLC